MRVEGGLLLGDRVADLGSDVELLLLPPRLIQGLDVIELGGAVLGRGGDFELPGGDVAGRRGDGDLTIELGAEARIGGGVLRRSRGFDRLEELPRRSEHDLHVVPGGPLVVPLLAAGLMGGEDTRDDSGVGTGVGALHVAERGPGELLAVAAVEQLGIDVGEAPGGVDDCAGLLPERVGIARQVVPYAGEVGDLTQQRFFGGRHLVELVLDQADGFDELSDGGNVDHGPLGIAEAYDHQRCNDEQPRAAFAPRGVLRLRVH